MTKPTHTPQTRRFGVAVFGSSEPAPGSPLYQTAVEVGRLLARSGFAVVCGGYGGVMEAASRGAHEAGGEATGVGCRIFAERSPNRFLTRVILTDDLFDRTRELVRLSEGFIVLGGKSGTLAELAFLWALHRAGCLGQRPVVLLGSQWEGWTAELERRGLLNPDQRAITRTVLTPADAVAAMGLVPRSSRPEIEEDE